MTTETMTALIESRAATCEDCGCPGTHVDTSDGEIVVAGAAVARVSLVETWLMTDPDGELRCGDCSTEMA